jgi:hypothetical protein
MKPLRKINLLNETRSLYKYNLGLKIIAITYGNKSHVYVFNFTINIQKI